MPENKNFTTEEHVALLHAVGLGFNRPEERIGDDNQFSWVDFCERHPTLPSEAVINILILISKRQHLKRQQILTHETKDLLVELQSISTPIRGVSHEIPDALAENVGSLQNAIKGCEHGLYREVKQIVGVD